jgi:hypothetical protein
MKKMIHTAVFFFLYFATFGQDVITRTHVWNYAGKTFTMTYNIKKDAYQWYATKAAGIPYQSSANYYRNFLQEDPNHTYLHYFANELQNIAKQQGYSRYQLVEFTMAFVRSFEYTKTSIAQFPIAVLVDASDCKGHSILLCNLLREESFRAGLLRFPQHLAVCVECANPNGQYYPIEGRNYVYIETTSKDWAFGEVPDCFKSETPTFFVI